MADQRQVVEQVFQGVDRVSPVLANISTQANAVAQSVKAFQDLLNMGMSAYRGVQGYAQQIISVGSAAENMRLTVAGTLRAYDMAGERMTDINRRFAEGTREWRDASTEAFHTAERVGAQALQTLENRAAALPGTAEDYLNVFQTALGAASRTHFMAAQRGTRPGDTAGTGVGGFTEFVAGFAATGLANQVDAGQTGRDLSLLLQGQAGVDVRMWRILQPLIHRNERSTENVLATTFNRWSAAQRSRAIERAVRAYRPLLDQLGDTWEAQTGTLASIRTRTIRETTEPIFSALSEALRKLNMALESVREKFTMVARVIATEIGAGMRFVVNQTLRFANVLGGALSRVSQSPAFARVAGAVGMVYENLQGSFTRGGREAIVTTTMASAALTGPLAASGLGGVMSLLYEHSDAVAIAFENLSHVMTPAVRLFQTVQGYYTALSTSMGNILARILPGLSGAFSVLAQYALVVANGVFTFFSVVVEQASPALEQLAGSAGQVLSVMGRLGSQALPYFAAAVQVTAEIMGRATAYIITRISQRTSGRLDTISEWLNGFGLMSTFRTVKAGFDTLVVPAITAIAPPLGVLTAGLSAAAGAVAEFGRHLGLVPWLRARAQTRAGLADTANEGTRLMREFEESVYRMRKAMAGVKSAEEGRRGGPNQRPPGAHNDFRYSRFDIHQRFAEGFDPDRIAAVFASDLEAMAEQRLTGGFVPVMSPAG